MIINIEKLNYNIKNNEFKKINHAEYNYLKLYDDIGIFERIIGLIKTLKECFDEDVNFISYDTTHGGFIPINLTTEFTKIYICQYDLEHITNIKNNINSLILKKNRNRLLICDSDNNFTGINNISLNISQDHILFHDVTQSIFITKNKLKSNFLIEYKLQHSEYYVYVGLKKNSLFTKIFHYYITENNILIFDNLINLCIMVKNGGPQFEQMLTANLNLIDSWTILDTGSTDNTIEIINNLLVGKKNGNLYQEPFINFKDSRNKLLELAGTKCKFNLMLDDTYIIKGNLREFLNEVRSDQYSNSFTLFIHSDDTKYGSNRITKSNSGLKYIHKIHEVITEQNNINIVIPENRAYIFDEIYDYMNTRTMDRKQLDLKLLFEEIDEDPTNPRAYYYLGQTYNQLEDYEKAFFYFMKRCEFSNSGFIQERFDAVFEAARIANFKLNKPWDECEQLYNNAFKIDESRPEPLYFIGIHYYLENNLNKAYIYFKKAFEIGFPIHCQYSLKPTLSFHFLPKFLCKICYGLNDYKLGLLSAELYLHHNNHTSQDYEEILSWHKIYKKLNIYSGPKIPKIPNKPILCFVADGGFYPWTGSNILTTGVGGSETYIIEMARYIKQNDFFEQIIVFCNTPEEKDEHFEGVNYLHLNKYYEFINNNYIHTCIISRFSEYLPVTFSGFVENVYFVVHDLTPSGIVIPINPKLKNIFCLTEWHSEYLSNIFPTLKHIIVPFYYGIDDSVDGFPNIQNKDITQYKQKYKFIYSSYPNRGLLELLQMWPEIYNFQPKSTLHIYSNIENEWSNRVEPDKMLKIKQLLHSYLDRNIGVHYYGWVSKKELSNAWKTSQYWLYPCTFMETFCLTALEAAKSKTLAITNNLAALKNTVGNRGIIIEGDPTTKEWQEKTLKHIKELLTDTNNSFYTEQIENNYNWALNLSWNNQANKLLNEYILTNNLEYKGMYNWTNDLPEGSKNIFLKIIEYFNINHIDKETKILEIGTYTGVSLINIIKLIPNSIGCGLDKWQSYEENELLTQIDNLQVETSFYNNIHNEGLSNRIFGIKSSSTDKLIEFIKNNVRFNFIYIDGSHLLLDCYADLVMSWNILDKGGIIAIDDYLYKKDDNILDSPFEAVNHFLKVFKEQYKLLNIGYRIFLEKI
jgi:predicted O-methyltransferase YrrM/tetratricopeptide (TPR) repeat protein